MFPFPYYRPAGDPANGDILYYAVNSMNLPTDNTSESSHMTRVTFDPEEAEEALNRSFQPFNDMFIRDTQVGTKRPASSQDHNTLHLSKRFHESNQTYEAQEGYAMS